MDGNIAESSNETCKAEKLRRFVTDTLAAASREILALLDTVVSAYEEEASVFRLQINRQRRQLELLQPPVTVSTAGVKSNRNQECDEKEEEEHNELQKELVSTDPSRCSASRRRPAQRKPGSPETTINLKLCILEDPRINVLSKNVLNKCPVVTLKCPRGLQEADFLDLLRSAVPQLAGDGRTVDFLTLDKRRRLRPVKVKMVTAEEIQRNLSCTGRSTLLIRLKTQEEPAEAVVPHGDSSSFVTSTCEKTKQQSSDSTDDVSIRPTALETADEDVEMSDREGSGIGGDGVGSRKPDRRQTDSQLQLPVAAFLCKVCGTTNTSEVTLVQHAWTHQAETGSVCGVCGDSVEALKDHLESRHKPNDHLCGESFLCVVGLGEHVAAHSGQPPCRQEPLEDHQNPHEPGHACQTCHKVFERKEQLKAHSRTHRTYLCGVCGKFLRDNRSLSRHKKTHSAERPHSCRVCGRGFKLPTTLKQHEKIHTDRERSYLCDVCCKMFLTSKQLLIHMRTHTNEKPYHCDECGKGFTTKGPLTIHMRVHTGETPYRCPHCGWSFKRKTHLDNHVAVHTGAKPYVCGICGKTCARKTYLTVHMRTHNGERPYKCSVCKKAFTQSHCLKTHMKSHQGAT